MLIVKLKNFKKMATIESKSKLEISNPKQATLKRYTGHVVSCTLQGSAKRLKGSLCKYGLITNTGQLIALEQLQTLYF